MWERVGCVLVVLNGLHYTLNASKDKGDLRYLLASGQYFLWGLHHNIFTGRRLLRFFSRFVLSEICKSDRLVDFHQVGGIIDQA